MKDDDECIEVKLVLLGSQSVGKSSIISAYLSDSPGDPSIQPTIGASYFTKTI